MIIRTKSCNDDNSSQWLGKFGASLEPYSRHKTYSSWSFRPWILMRHYGIAFDEIMIPLDNTREEILRVSPSSKCPALHDGDIIVWESLSIIEYLAEIHPEKPL